MNRREKELQAAALLAAAKRKLPLDLRDPAHDVGTRAGYRDGYCTIGGVIFEDGPATNGREGPSGRKRREVPRAELRKLARRGMPLPADAQCGRARTMRFYRMIKSGDLVAKPYGDSGRFFELHRPDGIWTGYEQLIRPAHHFLFLRRLTNAA